MIAENETAVGPTKMRSKTQVTKDLAEILFAGLQVNGPSYTCITACVPS